MTNDSRPAARMAADIRSDLRQAGSAGTEAVRGVRRKWTGTLKQQPASLVMDVANELAAAGAWPERVVAFELLQGHPGAFARLTPARVNALAEALTDWGSVDLFGVTVAGPAWRDGRIPDATVHAWTKSRDRWRRRLALVATVRLNTPARGTSGDARRTLTVCRRLAADRDDMVVKAMSWALRELAKRDPAAVKRFLAEEDGSLAPRVRREVTNKLRTGLKNPRSTTRS
jgi:3-methyladenine DNA glycosylase AlkD